MENDKFEVSGLPNYLEYYKCYHDQARDEWIDGMELRNHSEWDDRQVGKWLFFYRPIPSLVGRPQ